MIETIMKKENWRLFQEITGDDNRLHNDEEYAKKTIFGEIIAPGMYVASLIMKEPVKNFNRAILRFDKEVRPGDRIHVDPEINWVNQGNEIVIDGTLYGEYKEYKKDLRLEDLKEYSYSRKISEEDINNFWKAIEMDIEQKIAGEKIKVPRMYVVSLIAPSLLKYPGKIGMYRKQEFNFYRDAFVGDTITSYAKKIHERQIDETQKLGDFITLCVNQKNEIIVGGKASCTGL